MTIRKPRTGFSRPLALAFGALLLLSSLCGGLEEDFEMLRKRVADERSTVEVQLKKLLAARLQRLESRYVAAARYEDVAACRKMLEGIRKELGEKAWALPLSINILAAEADRMGVQLAGKALTGWGPPESSATWKLPGLPPGGYEVWIDHTPVGEPVEMRLEESVFFVQQALSPGLSGEDEWSRSSMGNLKITKGSGPLTLRMIGGAASKSMLKIKAVILIAHAP